MAAAWYTTSKLVWGMFRQVAVHSKQLSRNPIIGIPASVSPQIRRGVSNQCSRVVDLFGWRSSRFVHHQQVINPLLSSKFGWWSSRLGDKSNNIIRMKQKRWGYNYNYNYMKGFAALMGLASTAAYYFSNLERIPYTKRTHFVAVPRVLEKKFADFVFDKEYQDKLKVLPATHPKSIRVRLIAEKVFDALQRGLGDESIRGSPIYVTQALKPLWKQLFTAHDDDDKSSSSSPAPQYKCLEHIDLEVSVVDDVHENNGWCFPGGKIIISAGLLERFKSDAELAFLIAHEVGHAVARHSAETVTMGTGLIILLHVLLHKFVLPPMLKVVPALFVMSPLSRKMESEADYIGMLLMASAGYDPRIVVSVVEKLGKPQYGLFFSSHPCRKKRVQFVTQAQEEAIALYDESLSLRTPP